MKSNNHLRNIGLKLKYFQGKIIFMKFRIYVIVINCVAPILEVSTFHLHFALIIFKYHLGRQFLSIVIQRVFKIFI